jgi:hypothetical protein
MMLKDMVDAAMVEFKQLLEAFGENVELSRLTPQIAEDVAGALKTCLARAGAAAYRAFLLSHEVLEDTVIWQGEVFRFKQVREKIFLTPFGEMKLARRCFQNKSDTKSYVPLDSRWGMAGQYMTPEVREAVLFATAHVTPEEAAQLLKKSALFTPHATAIKHVVQNTGELIESHRAELEEAIRAQETIPEQTRALVASLDGTTVLLNEKGLFVGHRAKRPQGDDPKETPTSYRIAMVGSISCYGPPDEQGKPQRLCSRYVAQMPEKTCPTFKARLEAELDAAESAAPPDTPHILLLDGARELWNYLDKTPRFDNYHRCIDFWHVLEHLSTAANALFADSDQAKKWYKKYKELLKQSDNAAQRIVRSIDYHMSALGLNKNRRALVQEQRTYFKRNGIRMPYATFLQNGWPIGSGPIEAACKTLVKTRLCRSGMRWSRKGGQHILHLRTFVKSNRWETACEQIKQLGTVARAVESKQHPL